MKPIGDRPAGAITTREINDLLNEVPVCSPGTFTEADLGARCSWPPGGVSGPGTNNRPNRRFRLPQQAADALRRPADARD
jgi:hypothetical protein